MAVATASSNPVSNPYDEMVVPALRKRLEAESRALTSRMSGTFDAYDSEIPYAIASTVNGTSTSSAQPVAIPNSKSSRARVASPDVYSKPSSIPRPSLQMSAQYAQSTRDLLAGTAVAALNTNGAKAERGTRSEKIPQQPVMRDGERERSGGETDNDGKPQRVRSRTQSTPYAYNELVGPPTGATVDVPSALPTPASSRANSPQNQPNGVIAPTVAIPQALTGSALSSRPSGIPVPRSASAARGTPSGKTPRSRSRNATGAAIGTGSLDDGTTAAAADDLNLQHLTPAGRMRYPPSPEPSPELSYIRNVQAPFPLSGSMTAGGASDSEAGRSSFERDMRASRAARRRVPSRDPDIERMRATAGEGRGELELNYRGDTTRNGGRGEVYKEHTEEQLEIATFGHDLSMERKALNTGPPRRKGELDYLGVAEPRSMRLKGSAPSPSAKQQAAWGELASAAGYGTGEGYGEAYGEGYESGDMELHDESVIRERPLTWMVEGEASVTDLVLESLRNEGGRESVSFPPSGDQRQPSDSDETWELAYEQPQEEVPIRNGAGTASKIAQKKAQPQQVALSKSVPAGKRPADGPPTIASKKEAPKANGTPAGASASSSTAQARQRVASKPTPASRQRVASKPSKVSGPAASGKSNGQPRSKSHPANLHKHQQQDSNASMSLVDAIPDIPTRRRLERSENWDEVVLPTVAKQLGLDKENQGPDDPEPVQEEIVPPAPGTFGYDFSKYRSPSAMSMTTPVPTRPTSPQSADGHLAAPEKHSRRASREVKPQAPPVVQAPPRQPSPAPFASYSPMVMEPPLSPPPEPQPRLQKSATAMERQKEMRQSRPPKIKISPPAEFAMDLDQDEEKHTSGCKCTIM